VRHALRLGVLRPGDQLPTAREVVAKLAVNPNTVLKAYRELAREGLVGARPGQGTFVLRTLPGAAPATQARLRRDLDRWLLTARRAVLDAEAVDALYRAAVRDAFTANEEIA
jgi:GntR family transcriptional regulator